MKFQITTRVAIQLDKTHVQTKGYERFVKCLALQLKFSGNQMLLTRK